VSHCFTATTDNTEWWRKTATVKQRTIRTDGDVEAALRLQKPVRLLPHFRQPLHHLLDGHQAASGRTRTRALRRGLAARAGQLSTQVAAEETAHGFDVAGVENPPEVVVDLEISRARRRTLVHRSNNVRAATSITRRLRFSPTLLF